MFTIRDHFVLKSGEKHQLFRSLFLVLSFLLIFMAGNFVRPATATPLYTCADITEISADQCQALQAFVTENPSADALATWFQTNTPCSWSGIRCNLPNVVTSLDLSSNLSTDGSASRNRQFVPTLVFIFGRQSVDDNTSRNRQFVPTHHFGFV